jgi:hypothetical protein
MRTTDTGQFRRICMERFDRAEKYIREEKRTEDDIKRQIRIEQDTT